MKLNWKSGVILAASMTAALFAGMFLERACTNSQIKRMNNVIEAYRGYVVSTEHLLDLINAKWSWVDAFDHDGYYESRAEIEYLDSYGLLLEAERYAKVINDDSILINEIYGKN
jgi:hypothetical protein